MRFGRAVAITLSAMILAVPASLAPPAAAEQSDSRSVDNWSRDATIYEVNVRQYTEDGTFEAFETHLPRLQRLGVEILWLMPIHPISEAGRLGSLGSYYAPSDYKAVNPEFGTMADLQSLVDHAHERGLKVIMDFVPNHTGRDHVWTREHPDWYLRDEDGDLVPPPGTNFSDVAQLDWDNQAMREGLIDAMKFWITEADIDGYRVDYISGIPDDFWPQVDEALNQLPKQLFMLAENEDKTHILGEPFRANYGWSTFHRMVEVAEGTTEPEAIRANIEQTQAAYPRNTYQMLFTSNHDENSWNGTTQELFGDAEKTMAVMTFVAPGMPLIYSGQEAGLDQQLLFFDKDEISWADLSMQQFYEDLTRLKKENRALWNGAAGGPAQFLQTDDADVLAFVRERADNRVVVVVNLSDGATTTEIKLGSQGGRLVDYFSGQSVDLNDQHSFDLAPWEYRVLVG